MVFGNDGLHRLGQRKVFYTANKVEDALRGLNLEVAMLNRPALFNLFDIRNQRCADGIGWGNGQTQHGHNKIYGC